MPSIEGLAEASGLTRAELLRRGLAAGLAVGAAGVLADGASGATPKAPHPRGYLVEQSTRPQTLGYALLDSPVALAAWRLDHDTDSYYKISRAFVDGRPTGNLTREHIVDNIAVYWLTGTGASAARSYWESARAQALAGGQAPPPVRLPVGFSAFPGELFQARRSWVELGYPNVTYYNKPARGGHFAAWEEPELFAGEVRAAFRSLR